MCLECGHYKGRMVVDMAAKKKARGERLQAKREMIHAEQGAPEAVEVEETKAVEPEVTEKK